MQLPDRNVRPIGFLKSLHSSPALPTGPGPDRGRGRQAQGGAFGSIFVNGLLFVYLSTFVVQSSPSFQFLPTLRKIILVEVSIQN
jgi:hypothetical protein